MTSVIKKIAAAAVLTAGVGAMTLATTAPAAAAWRGGYHGGWHGAGWHGAGWHGGWRGAGWRGAGWRGGYAYRGYGYRGYGYRGYGWGPAVGLGIAGAALTAGAIAGATADPYYYGSGYYPYGYDAPAAYYPYNGVGYDYGW